MSAIIVAKVARLRFFLVYVIDTLPGHEEPCTLQFQGRYRFPKCPEFAEFQLSRSLLCLDHSSPEHVLALRVPGEIFWGTGS